MKKNQSETKKTQENLSKIKRKIVVLSGKGGVGKTTVSTNLAVGLSLKNYKVGLLDVDLHGPNVPNMLGLKNTSPKITPEGIHPVEYSENLKVISIGFFAKDEDAIIWRGPLKHKAIQQFLTDTIWGELDFLVADCPPGTGDEILSIYHVLNKVDGAIIVATPQNVALADVKRSIRFCQETKIPIIGIIENMSGFVCPKCGTQIDIFKTGGAKKLAEKYNIPFLGKIPIDPSLVQAEDEGKPYVKYYPESETAKAFFQIIENLENQLIK
ncbi:MAG: Mrp/NBP35 family ATP-binding protein [Thermodesulfobacterium sp.]|nr:Mrp/NBP35 family ATP-binding protein [Thermodesulfobacterium sp.]